MPGPAIAPSTACPPPAPPRSRIPVPGRAKLVPAPQGLRGASRSDDGKGGGPVGASNSAGGGGGGPAPGLGTAGRDR